MGPRLRDLCAGTSTPSKGVCSGHVTVARDNLTCYMRHNCNFRDTVRSIMFSILHITDLHRSKSDPITNPELLSALVNDRRHYTGEDPPISTPQAIVVSGDLIQGVGLGHPDPDAELAAQYEDAYDFLGQLTDRFVDGDRSKVVIIPGNHDIDWNRARAAMEPVHAKDMPPDLQRALHEPGSPYRWSWKSRELFIINDQDTYRQRLGAFWRFFERFYAGVPDLLRVAPWSDANLYSLDQGRIGVAAFNSCVGNDCFSYKGEIPREAVAQADLDLQDLGAWRLRIAVWHHDIEGPPNRSDYMDPEIVRGMVGRGFRLGLYGHQHRTQITQNIYLPKRETMAVASAGSLCAGARELPTGAWRGYSIIEIGDQYDRARVHVREMAYANLFSRANLAIFGGRSYVDLEWTAPVDAAGRAEDPDRKKRAAILQAAELALRQRKDPHEAIRLLDMIPVDADPFGRKLKLNAIEATGEPERMIALVKEPQTIEELVLGIEAYLAGSRHDEAITLLGAHGGRLQLQSAQWTDLEQKIELIRRMRR
jgi:predicted MPP superfamily phosphohydrolase